MSRKNKIANHSQHKSLSSSIVNTRVIINTKVIIAIIFNTRVFVITIVNTRDNIKVALLAKSKI